VGRAWILAVDLGSGGPKVGAVGLDGEILATSFTAVPTVHTEDGGHEQDVTLWWDGIRRSVRDFVDGGVVAGGDLHAVGLTSQWSSLVPVGADGEPTYPCLMWSDHRGQRYSQEAVGGPVLGWAPEVLARAVPLTGAAALTTGEDPLGHELFLRHERPDAYARTRVLLEPMDYLGLRFTGRAAATPASMVNSWLVDSRPGRPRRYVGSLVRRYHREPRLLPELLPTGSVLGPVTAEVAAELGIRAGAPVVCGVPDFLASYVGSGSVGLFAMHAAISTTSWITGRVPTKHLDLRHFMTSIPGLEPGSYLLINDQASAGYCLRWWMDRTAEVASLTGARALDYHELLEPAAAVPPGSTGVLFLPWLRGERSPVDDRSARAGFVNVSAHTDLPAMTRAVLEGVAYNARWLMQAVERYVSQPVPSLRLLGGGAQSDLWCQIYADVLGRPIERVAEPMFAQLRGVALLARHGLGEVPLSEAAALVPVADTFHPQPGSSTVYDPLFTEFTRLFGSLRPHHRRLNR
jgi:xylulokinase